MSLRKHAKKLENELTPGQIKNLGVENFSRVIIKYSGSTRQEIDDMRKWCSETLGHPFSCQKGYADFPSQKSLDARNYIFYFTSKEDMIKFYFTYKEKIHKCINI